MTGFERVRARIRANPHGHAERTLLDLVVALESNGTIDVAPLYALDYETFSLAMDVMHSWWLQRHTGIARNGVADSLEMPVERRAANPDVRS
jgi:hypothetical protein